MPSIAALLGLDELLYEDIRRWHINGFDRLIILYRETTAGIEVVRVLHTAPATLLPASRQQRLTAKAACFELCCRQNSGGRQGNMETPVGYQMVSMPHERILRSQVTSGRQWCHAVAAMIRSGISGTSLREMSCRARTTP
jgi:hypothetical protein